MRPAIIVLALVACGPAPAPHQPTPPAGDVHRTIATSSPEAQRHFDVGLAHAYGFNFDAAKIEFEAALAADPQCAMCEWGIAYSGGWNINERTKRWPGVFEAAQKARSLAKDPIESALADALIQRYHPIFKETPRDIDPANPPDYTSTGVEDHAYLKAMDALVTAHPDDDDVAVLFAEAAMLSLRLGEPYWPTGMVDWIDNATGTRTRIPHPIDKSITRARSVLEQVLARSPDHIGAIHFYIHLMEESADRGKAIPYAEKLARLAPTSGHLIHMASHLYLRVGRYADAEDANHQAIAADAEMVKHLPADATYAKFAMHPKHFLWQTLLWQGERANARKLADELVPHFQHMAMSVPQPLGTDAMIATFTAVRFSDWDAAIAVEDGDLPVALIATHYARGLAFVAKGRLDDAQREIEILATTTLVNAPYGYRPRLVQVARLAHEHVSAAILVAQGHADQAVEVLRKAVEMEDKLDNPMEPELWIFSSRERLGALLLKLGKNQQAADTFRADLPRHPENGWTLFGLATALEALHDSEAPAIRKRFEKAWARSDFKLTPDLL